MAELWQWNAPRLSAGFCSTRNLAGRGGAGAAGAHRHARQEDQCLLPDRRSHDLGAGARASEARWVKDAPLSPLDGVPVAVKDLLLTRGWPTLRGSRTIDPNQPWNDDAPVSRGLREAGAVLLGKATTPDHGWKGVTDSPLTGITRNPWNLEKTPGGSSGGSSAALAARLAPLALGTDGGGSIRIPASFTGVFGLKPNFGRVPAWPLSPFGTLVASRADEPRCRRQRHAAGYHCPARCARLAGPAAGRRKAFTDGLRSRRARQDASPSARRWALPRMSTPRSGGAGRRGRQALFRSGRPCRGSRSARRRSRCEIFRTLWWAGAGFLFGARDAGEESPARSRAAGDGGRGGGDSARADYIEANVARGAYASKMRVFMEKYRSSAHARRWR